jgi:CDP-4-dehydro-6-deoxyglucose reductase, E3
MLQSFTADIARTTDLTHDVREIELRLVDPQEIHFTAGQFVSFRVRKLDATGLVSRLYSIVSPPSERHIVLLLLNLVPGGPGSTYLFGLRPGDRTQFKGPAGAFQLRNDSRDVLFVATGTGIAPLRSMLLTLLESETRRAITLYWGLRSPRDLYFQDFFSALQEQHDNFSFVTTLSRPDETWRGVGGRVTRLVEERVSSVANLVAYLCGNSGMIDDVSAILRTKGDCPIYRELYYAD